ncbi:MAG TPA: hypothetical protein V6C88_05860 [Chroococcidiopsis sp.]
MTTTPEPNELSEIVKGAALLLGCHLLAGLLIFALGYVIGSIVGGYSIFAVWLVGAMGFLFWQLLYVIPLILWLRRRGKTGMIKGVIIVAVLTALLNGACFLAFQR